MEFITLPDKKQSSTISEGTSYDLRIGFLSADITKRKASSSDSQTETKASDCCDITLPDRCVFPPAHGKPRILRTGKSGRPRKEYGQVSVISDCFETSPKVQEALARPNKLAWKML
ncbi:hypothetical protein NPIL_504621 [Nephila pilipes]|uniref:Uncharacterized protein n=1 Tax=Nephila pilipes TaxID=299642 RepID=A0A8X6TGW1_NEPPI|nr:hypothetical protein NPIL_504621 [Nephila pilipes]